MCSYNSISLPLFYKSVHYKYCIRPVQKTLFIKTPFFNCEQFVIKSHLVLGERAALKSVSPQNRGQAASQAVSQAVCKGGN